MSKIGLYPEFPYRNYLPSAYDPSMNIYETLVSMREYLNQVIQLTNETNNEVKKFIEEINKTIEKYTEEEILELKEQGYFYDLINSEIFGEINRKIIELQLNKADKSALSVTDGKVFSLESNKADKKYVEEIIKNVGNGKPSGVFNTVDELRGAFPNGNTNIYVTKDTGDWYYWNGSSWTSGGNYQGTVLGDLVVKSTNISKRAISPLDISNQKMLNILNPNTLTVGQIVDNTGAMTELAGHAVTEAIPVNEGDVYTLKSSLSSQGGFYDASKVWKAQIPQATSITGGGFTFKVPAGISFMRVNIVNQNDFMIVKGNKYPEKFYRYGEKVEIDWLKPNVETIPKQSVFMDNMNGASLMNMFNLNTITPDKYINNDGAILDSTTLAMSDYIPVVEGGDYSSSKGYSTMGGMYDKNNQYVGPIPHPDNSTGTPYAFKIPNGVSKVRLNVEKGFLTRHMLVPSSTYPSEYMNYGSVIDWITPNIKTLPRNLINLENFSTDKQVNLFNKNTVTNNKYVDNTGEIKDLNNFSLSDFIPVIPPDNHTVTYGLSSQGGMYDINKKWIAPVPTIGSSQNPYTFRFPRNVAYLRLNMDTSKVNSFMLVVGSTYPEHYIPYGVEVPWIITPDGSTLNGETVQWFGDSMTEKNFRTIKNYHEYMSELAGIVNIVNGVSGTGWRTPNSAGTGRPIHERITQISELAKYVGIFAGVNDWIQTGEELVLGNIGDTDPKATFYGAVDYTIKKAIELKKDVKLFTITPIQSKDGFNPNNKGVTLEVIAKAIEEVSKKYGIPCFNAYYQNNLNVWNSESEKYYFTAPGQPSPDGLHPNDNGHQVLAIKFLEFLKGI